MLEEILDWCRFNEKRYGGRSKRSQRGHGKSGALRISEWRNRYPEKALSHTIAKEIELKPCEVCGSMVNIHRHHHNYNKPNDVIFLCRQHHKDMHSWDNVRG